MTKDLEETLKELGPGYRAVVDRLAAGSALPFGRSRRAFSFRPAMLAAASFAILLLGAAGLILGRFTGGAASAAQSANAAIEYRLAEISDAAALHELIRTQNPDGSWQTDFLTRRNAAALAARPEMEAKIACKKARRHLRNRGLL